VVGIVEGFDPKGVTDEREAFFSRVPDGEGEHAVEAGKTVGAILCPGLEKDFGIGLGTKGGATGLEIAAEFEVVVDFTVKYDVPAAVGGGHGLGPSGKIEDAKATVPKANGRVGVCAFGVRSAMGEGIGHFG
jgi:hypothetical protein